MLSADMQVELAALVAGGNELLVGDGTGVDMVAQRYLAETKYRHVTIYTSHRSVRMNEGMWDVHSRWGEASACCTRLAGYRFEAVKSETWRSVRTMAPWHGTVEAVVPSSQSSCLLHSASLSALCGRTGLLRSNVWMTYIQSSLPKDLSIRLEKMASLQRSRNGLRTPSSHRGLWLCSLPVSLSPVGLSLRSPLGRRHLWSRNTRQQELRPLR